MPAGKVWEKGRWRDAEVAPIQAPGHATPAGPCEDCTEGVAHMAGSVDDVPLWKPGERRLYDGDSGDGVHTFAELIEIEDEMRHAYD